MRSGHNSRARAALERASTKLRHRDKRLERKDLLRTIDTLTEMNRHEPDVDRERRLVELRHLAANGLGRRPVHEVLSPRASDPFPGVLLPEIQGSELSVEALRGGVLHHGAALARGLIDAPGVACLVECIDRAFDANAERRERLARGDVALEEDDPWFFPFGRLPVSFGLGTEWLRMIDAPRAMFEYSERLGGLGRGPITDYLGERPVMDSHKWTLRRITPDCGGEWHQDARVLADGVRVLSVWIALTRCGGGTPAPGLEVVPRRLGLVPTGTGDTVFGWTIDPTLIDSIAEGTVCDPVYEPGDALIFDERTAHRTGHRAGLTTTRHSIEAWFFAPSTHHKVADSFAF